MIDIIISTSLNNKILPSYAVLPVGSFHLQHATEEDHCQVINPSKFVQRLCVCVSVKVYIFLNEWTSSECMFIYWCQTYAFLNRYVYKYVYIKKRGNHVT